MVSNIENEQATAEETVKEDESGEAKTAKTHKKSSEKADLKLKIDELEKANADITDKLMRAAAEFDNYKKRTIKEKDELAGYTRAGCVKELLTVLDSFERALESECKDETYKNGMDMIFKQFNTSLQAMGVVEIEAMNKPFNPELHNAINQIEDENFGENTVCQVMQKGYQIGNRVIRHAMVVVANP